MDAGTASPRRHGGTEDGGDEGNGERTTAFTAKGAKNAKEDERQDQSWPHLACLACLACLAVDDVGRAALRTVYRRRLWGRKFFGPE